MPRNVVRFVLPVLVRDAAARTLTFKTTVPESAIQTLTAIQPGRSIGVITPMNQPSEAAVIASIAASDPPQPTLAPTSEAPQESPNQPRTR